MYKVCTGDSLVLLYRSYFVRIFFQFSYCQFKMLTRRYLLMSDGVMSDVCMHAITAGTILEEVKMIKIVINLCTL